MWRPEVHGLVAGPPPLLSTTAPGAGRGEGAAAAVETHPPLGTWHLPGNRPLADSCHCFSGRHRLAALGPCPAPHFSKVGDPALVEPLPHPLSSCTGIPTPQSTMLGGGSQRIPHPYQMGQGGLSTISLLLSLSLWITQGQISQPVGEAGC